MNYVVLFFAIIISWNCSASQNIKVYYEQTENGYSVYADNMEYCPVSVKIDFTVTNLDISFGNNITYTLTSTTKKQLLTQLTVINKNKAYKFNFKWISNYGDQDTEYDIAFNYSLPFETSNTFNLFQGYNGNFSHQNDNALDFSMPVGTKITAVRDGVIIKVVENNDRNCAQEECKKYNNSILIYHPDGTFAEYAHIKYNGSLVKVGDKIAQNQILGYSGNVGWSTGPHLHLAIFLQGINKRKTLKTKFKTDNGKAAEFLEEGADYSKNY